MMVMSKKPFLYNDQIVSRKYRISKRIFSADNFEIYLTDQNLIFVLFISLQLNLLEKHFEVKTFILNQAQFHYVIFDKTVTLSSIKRTIDSVLNPKGLDSIAGMNDLKQVFLKDIIEPLTNKDRFEKFKIAMPNAILLFGPPGCGKTYFIKKISEEIGYHLIMTSQSTYGSSFIHGTSLKIKEVFDEAISHSPCLLFIDEIDSLFPKREGLGIGQSHKQEEINEFLVQMNQLAKAGVLLLAATNKPQLIDEALLRTGRMDKLIYVGLPDLQSRIDLFGYYLRNRPIDQISLEKVSEFTEGYSCSDIEYIANESAKTALFNNQERITEDNILEVIQKTKPSISKASIKQYEEFQHLSRG
jgi:transitional endoplasmic reticulum ATPase